MASSTTGTALLTVDDSGNLNIAGTLIQVPNLLSVYATTTQGIGNAAWTVVIFEVIADAKGGFSATTVPTATSTIPSTGDYEVSIDMFADKTGGAVHIIEVALFRNDTIVKDDAAGQDCTSERSVNSTNETGFFELHCIIALTAGDDLTLKAQANEASAQFNRSGSAITAGATVRMVIEQVD